MLISHVEVAKHSAAEDVASSRTRLFPDLGFFNIIPHMSVSGNPGILVAAVP